MDNRLVDIDVRAFNRIVEYGTDAEQDALFEIIAAASPEELVPFLLQNFQLAGFRFTALDCAVHLGKLRLVRLLLQKGAVHIPEENNGVTTLMLAARHTNVLLYFLQELIDCNAVADNVNAQDNFGWTALHYAVRNPKAVELLLEHGADPSIRSNMGTPLCFAARQGHTDSAALLWNYGADIKYGNTENDCDTVLMTAAVRNTEVLRYFLQKLNNKDDIINLKDHNGWTALHWAHSNPQAVELLLKHGADPNIRNHQQSPPLHEAASRHNTQSTALLLQCGADISLTDHQKRNVMHHALGHGEDSTRFVQWLLEHGAEHLMFAKDQFGRTPLDEAIHQKQHRLVDILIEHYQTKIVAQEGSICLHWILRAAIYKRGKVVLPVGTLTMGHMLMFLTLFLSDDPNLITAGDDTGALPLHIACQYPKTPIWLMEFLVDQDLSTVRQSDLAGNLPIHTLCASRPFLPKVECLLGRYDKGSVAVLNDQGRSPFEVALLSSASLDVIWFLMKVDPVTALASLRVALAASP